MKLKKFEAITEDEAIEKVKNELGTEALILNIKKTQPRGLFSVFRKPLVEVTAAYDDRALKQPGIFKPQQFEVPVMEPREIPRQAAAPVNDIEKDKLLMDQMVKNMKISEQQVKIENLQNLVNDINQELEYAKQFQAPGPKYGDSILQAFYETMLSQGVMEEVAEVALKDALIVEELDEIDINLAVKIVYNNIISMIGRPEDEPEYIDEDGKVIVFMGPTGVGKTTTIAKLTSNYILRDNLRVGLITADTYRIAAVEQLKTYAEILDIDVKVVYDHSELSRNLSSMRNFYDVICIDTAGRSHRNDGNLEDLQEMLEKTGDSERYLVLSSTTKNEDLLNIIERYSNMSDFKLILTKLDETLNFGAILNICYMTGKKVEFITTGQNVPDDIERIQPEKIAKSLLGLGGAY